MFSFPAVFSCAFELSVGRVFRRRIFESHGGIVEMDGGEGNDDSVFVKQLFNGNADLAAGFKGFVGVCGAHHAAKIDSAVAEVSYNRSCHRSVFLFLFFGAGIVLHSNGRYQPLSLIWNPYFSGFSVMHLRARMRKTYLCVSSGSSMS